MKQKNSIFYAILFIFVHNKNMWLVILFIILVIVLYVEINVEYDLIANYGEILIKIFYIPVIYLKLNITKQFLIITTSRQIFELSLRINEEDLVFLNTFLNHFKKHTYGKSLIFDCNIGYRDSYDIVRLYSILHLITYYYANIIYTIYPNIFLNRNIFYSFTNTNCKIRFITFTINCFTTLIFIFFRTWWIHNIF